MAGDLVRSKFIPVGAIVRMVWLNPKMKDTNRLALQSRTRSFASWHKTRKARSVLFFSASGLCHKVHIDRHRDVVADSVLARGLEVVSRRASSYRKERKKDRAKERESYKYEENSG